MSRSVIFAPGEFYHLYNRGTEKREIFLDDSDRKRFMLLLYLCNGSIPVDLKQYGQTFREVLEVDRGVSLVEIGAYCLMPNHVHLLVRPITDAGISRFMQKLTTAYTMYFNKKYDRSGALFQGKFKATHAADDRYLKYLIAYIHLNPVKLIDKQWKENGIRNRSQAETFLTRYQYSSFVDYWRKGLRPEQYILTKESLPGYFRSGSDFKEAVTEWLDYRPE